MESTIAKFLLLLVFFHSGTNLIDEVTANEYGSNEEKHEKLQIEGTIRNVDEWKLPHSHDKELGQEGSRFNSYWAQLNWGPKGNKWPRQENQINWQESKSANWDRFNEGESTNYQTDNEAEMLNPEAEMIDPSKVSNQLANLKFMRMEKKTKKTV